MSRSTRSGLLPTAGRSMRLGRVINCVSSAPTVPRSRRSAYPQTPPGSSCRRLRRLLTLRARHQLAPYGPHPTRLCAFPSLRLWGGQGEGRVQRYPSSPMASSGEALSVRLPEPHDGARMPSAIRRSLVLAGVGLLYLAIAVGFFATIWLTPGGPFSSALGVGGDPQLAIWFLRWQGFALAHGHNLLLTTYLDAPQGVKLIWNTTAPLLGVALAPLTLTLGGVFAYNVAETLGLASSAMAAFVMIRRYVRVPDSIGTLAALVGGGLFGFSPYMAAHALGHPPAVTLFTAPLMLLVFDDLFVRQAGRATRPGVW